MRVVDAGVGTTTPDRWNGDALSSAVPEHTGFGPRPSFGRPFILDASRMFGATGGLVLFAALLHASWNAMLHGHRDRLLSMTWMSMATAALASVVVLVVPPPAASAWPYVVASGLAHIVYNVALVRAYASGELAQAYPIARGASPLLVTLGAAMIAGETIGPLHALGIAMICGGILALALHGRRVSRAGLAAALATGATIAVYTVVDGIGVRSSGGDVVGYTAWMYLFFWLMPVLLVAVRGPAALWTPVRTAPRAVVVSLAGGLVSTAAYGIVIWAMRSGAMGAVSALRETSVVFAVLIARVFLRERVGAVRWTACIVVAIGAVCLGL